MPYMCIVINVVIYIHCSMVTALGSIVIQEFIFRNKILLLLQGVSTKLYLDTSTHRLHFNK